MEDIEAEIHNDGDDSTHDLFEQNDDVATDDGQVDDTIRDNYPPPVQDRLDPVIHDDERDHLIEVNVNYSDSVTYIGSPACAMMSAAEKNAFLALCLAFPLEEAIARFHPSNGGRPTDIIDPAEISTAASLFVDPPPAAPVTAPTAPAPPRAPTPNPRSGS
jgi:hypothetical protein